jgi:hypothetical protein
MDNDTNASPAVASTGLLAALIYHEGTAEVAEECDRIRIDQLRRSARATEGPREVLKPIRQTWMLHPSWADLTRPPPDRKPS